MVGYRKDNNKLYSIYIISNKDQLYYIINQLNGLIRLKYELFNKACKALDINVIELNYNILKNSLYLAGLIDTDGTIVFNSNMNRPP